jgi:hypothetical protein
VATSVDLRVLRAGDTAKPDPYTICFVANPVLEAPWQSFAVVADPMPANGAAFDAAVDYAMACLFGTLPGQAEHLLSDPQIAAFVRIVSLRVSGLPVTAANALVGESVLGHLLAPRRADMAAFVKRFDIDADVILAVSQSATYTRESAFAATDDDAGPGAAFTVDGVTRFHRHRCLIPGTVALHASSRSLTPLHEFGHAASSFSNGQITDLYVDAPPALNCKAGRPIPLAFGSLQAAAYSTDSLRGGLGYPPAWLSYHCELIDPARPAVMDNYTTVVDPLACCHDRITRQFLVDRVVAKIGR